MQAIVERLANDDEFLAPILQTSYFSWQYKYLEALVRFGNVLTRKSKPWQIRDLLMLVKSELSKVHLVAALIKHSKEPGLNRYILNENEIFQLSNFLGKSEGDFVGDLLQAVSPFPDEVKEKAYKFINLLDPNCCPKDSPDHFAMVKSSNWEHSFVTPVGLRQGNTILESVGMSVQINPQPLSQILNSISDFLTNHVKVATSLNFMECPSRKSTISIEEVDTERTVSLPLLTQE